MVTLRASAPGAAKPRPPDLGPPPNVLTIVYKDHAEAAARQLCQLYQPRRPSLTVGGRCAGDIVHTKPPFRGGCHQSKGLLEYARERAAKAVFAGEQQPSIFLWSCPEIEATRQLHASPRHRHGLSPGSPSSRRGSDGSGQYDTKGFVVPGSIIVKVGRRSYLPCSCCGPGMCAPTCRLPLWGTCRSDCRHVRADWPLTIRSRWRRKGYVKHYEMSPAHYTLESP